MGIFLKPNPVCPGLIRLSDPYREAKDCPGGHLSTPTYLEAHKWLGQWINRGEQLTVTGEGAAYLPGRTGHSMSVRVPRQKLGERGNYNTARELEEKSARQSCRLHTLSPSCGRSLIRLGTVAIVRSAKCTVNLSEHHQVVPGSAAVQRGKLNRCGGLMRRVSSEERRKEGCVIREFLLPIGLPILVFGVLLLARLDLEGATRAALHGLCSQRPSHSFWLGGRVLPFDARMTGIYGGAFLTVLWLLFRLPARRAGLPAWWLTALLSLGVLALAVDGLNSLAVDLGLPHVYTPRNMLRLITGLWAGVALGVLLIWVFQSTTWQPSVRSEKPVMTVLRDGVPIFAFLFGFGWLVTRGSGWLYAPLAVFLVFAASAVLSLFAWPLVLTLQGRLEKATSWEGLCETGWWAVTLALSVMVVLAGARFALEAWLGLQPLR